MINKPNENSKPASANKKNEVDNKLISSFNIPKKIEKIYSKTQIISEYNNKFNKLLALIKKKKSNIQNIVPLKAIKLCIKFYL